MNILLIVLMLVLSVLAVVMLKAKNSAVAAVCAVLVGLLAVVRMLDPWGEPAGVTYVKKNHEVLAYGVAQKIAERYPDAKKVAILGPQLPEGKTDSLGFKPIERSLSDILENKFSKEVQFLAIGSKFYIGDQSAVTNEYYDHLATYEEELSPLKDSLALLNDAVDVVVVTTPISVNGSFDQFPAGEDAPKIVLLKLTSSSKLKEVMKETALDLVLKFHLNSSKFKTKAWPKNKAEGFNQLYYFESADGTGPEQVSLNFKK